MAKALSFKIGESRSPRTGRSKSSAKILKFWLNFGCRNREKVHPRPSRISLRQAQGGEGTRTTGPRSFDPEALDGGKSRGKDAKQEAKPAGSEHLAAGSNSDYEYKTASSKKLTPPPGFSKFRFPCCILLTAICLLVSLGVLARHTIYIDEVVPLKIC